MWADVVDPDHDGMGENAALPETIADLWRRRTALPTRRADMGGATVEGDEGFDVQLCERKRKKKLQWVFAGGGGGSVGLGSRCAQSYEAILTFSVGIIFDPKARQKHPATKTLSPLQTECYQKTTQLSIEN